MFCVHLYTLETEFGCWIDQPYYRTGLRGRNSPRLGTLATAWNSCPGSELLSGGLADVRTFEKFSSRLETRRRGRTHSCSRSVPPALSMSLCVLVEKLKDCTGHFL
jgi:hypothetical protein